MIDCKLFKIERLNKRGEPDPKGKDLCFTISIPTWNVKLLKLSSKSLPSGSEPTVELREDATTKHVEFGIPKGQDGLTGATGLTGLQGAVRAKGDKGDKGDKGEQGLTGQIDLSILDNYVSKSELCNEIAEQDCCKDGSSSQIPDDMYVIFARIYEYYNPLNAMWRNNWLLHALEGVPVYYIQYCIEDEIIYLREQIDELKQALLTAIQRDPDFIENIVRRWDMFNIYPYTTGTEIYDRWTFLLDNQFALLECWNIEVFRTLDMFQNLQPRIPPIDALLYLNNITAKFQTFPDNIFPNWKTKYINTMHW